MISSSLRWLIAMALVQGNIAFAINGSNLIAVSPTGTAMGGTGTAFFASTTESLHKNPSLLNWAPGLADGQTAVELDFSFLNVDATSTYGFSAAALAGALDGSSASRASGKFIPQVGVVYRLNPTLTVGLGLLSYGGTLADYSTIAQASQQKTSFAISKIVPTVAYQPMDGLTLGVAPIIGYGEFMLNENRSTVAAGSGPQSGRAPHGSLAVGFQLGGAYQIIPEVTVGFAYISKTNYKFKDLTDFDSFGTSTAGTEALDDLDLQHPSEITVGVSATPLQNLTLAFDWRLINWSSADALKDFGWKDQHVLALGASYAISKLVLRAGFNYGASPLDNVTGEVGAAGLGTGGTVNLQGHTVNNQSVSSLNAFSFPAATSTHLTLGAGYEVTDTINVDLGFMYAFQATLTRQGSGAVETPATVLTPYSYATAISQWMINLGGTIRL